jgi:ArsR family transcriptional regulator
VFGDPTRLKIVNALLLEEICVCDVAAVLGMSQPAVSHHLKVLKAARLVKYRRDGKQIYYSLDDEHVANIFYQGLMHVSHA